MEQIPLYADLGALDASTTMAGDCVRVCHLLVRRASAVRGQAAKTSKACRLLPLADIEAVYKAKPEAPWRASDTPISECTLTVGDYGVSIQTSPPPFVSRPGMTIAQVLNAIKRLGAIGEQKFETKDFGDVGCYRTSVTPPDAQNVCFVLADGGLTLELSSDPRRPIELDVVRRLLLKAVDARRSAK